MHTHNTVKSEGVYKAISESPKDLRTELGYGPCSEATLNYLLTSISHPKLPWRPKDN